MNANIITISVSVKDIKHIQQHMAPDSLGSEYMRPYSLNELGSMSHTLEQKNFIQHCQILKGTFRK